VTQLGVGPCPSVHRGRYSAGQSPAATSGIRFASPRRYRASSVRSVSSTSRSSASAGDSWGKFESTTSLA